MHRVAPTVFIVEDAPEVRKSLLRLIAAAGYEVRAYESAECFLRERRDNSPGCLLLDVGLPGLSGPELQRVLAASPYALPIVFLTGMGDVQTSVEAMKEGAVDFLTKPIDGTRLFAAVEQALRHDEEHRLRVALREVIRRRVESLTLRERQVMTYVVGGLLNKQIAAKLGTGEKTVKVQRARMMTKMEARSVPELVQLSERVGVKIQPALSLGASDLRWIRPQCPMSKALA